jgi:hypothetical protein
MKITFRQSPYFSPRVRQYPIRGVVSHRIVGTLKSARAAFGVAPGTSRNASTHFGIGFVDGELVIDQFVDLSDMAWGNGDVRNPTWPRLLVGANPNLYTVSIEHEDGGAANRGRVHDAIWEASIALQKLITSGNVGAIRNAGVRVRETRTVAQLAAIPKDETGFIDHHQIAGPNKPYCFRRWLDDAGFVEGSPSRRDRLLAALNGQEDPEMPALTYVPQLWTAGPSGAALRREPTTASPTVARVDAGKPVFTTHESKDGRWRLGVADDSSDPDGEGGFWILRSELVPLSDGRDPTLRGGIASVVNARLVGHPVPSEGAAMKRIGKAATHLETASRELAAAQSALQG